MGYRAQA
jgi:hypothetical protein